MPGAPYNLSLKLGETYTLTLGYYDEDGNIIDLSAYSEARLDIKATRDPDATPIIGLTKTAGDIVLAATDPNISVTFDDSQITEANLTPGTVYQYDLFVYDATDEPDCVLDGEVTPIGQVTANS